jgi:hypothetical protein
MQGVLLADDITLALLTGASDRVAEETARWVVTQDHSGSISWAQHTPRMTALAFREGLRLNTRSTVLNRRLEVSRAQSFLLPIGRIETLADKQELLSKGGTNGFSKLRAVNDASRIRYSNEGADVCSTTPTARFCIRLPLLVGGKTYADAWNALPPIPDSSWDSAVPSFRSQDWLNTFLGVQVEVRDRSVQAIDGARIVRATPVKLVMFNLGYLAGTASFEVQP